MPLTAQDRRWGGGAEQEAGRCVLPVPSLSLGALAVVVLPATVRCCTSAQLLRCNPAPKLACLASVGMRRSVAMAKRCRQRHCRCNLFAVGFFGTPILLRSLSTWLLLLRRSADSLFHSALVLAHRPLCLSNVAPFGHRNTLNFSYCRCSTLPRQCAVPVGAAADGEARWRDQWMRWIPGWRGCRPSSASACWPER